MSFDTPQPLGDTDLLARNEEPYTVEPVIDYEITPTELLDLEQSVDTTWIDPDPQFLDPEIVTPEMLELEQQPVPKNPSFEFAEEQVLPEGNKTTMGSGQ